jgi:hypothetical protein
MSSAASFKGNFGKRQDEPRPGTRIRKAYDALVANPGIPVSLSEAIGDTNSRGKILEQLQDIYGLDFRLWRQGSVSRGPSLYVLVGRWNGNNYEDYLPSKKLDELRRQSFMPER